MSPKNFLQKNYRSSFQLSTCGIRKKPENKKKILIYPTGYIGLLTDI
jgi:hypothetical protein